MSEISVVLHHFTWDLQQTLKNQATITKSRADLQNSKLWCKIISIKVGEMRKAKDLSASLQQWLQQLLN
jgi:hypothetical protein